MTIKYPLRVFLDLSTAHLKPTTPHWLAEQTSRYEELRQSVYVAATPHGWLVYAEHGIGTADAEIEEWSEEHGVPEDLARCMVKAIELGAEYILFDSEAQASDLLPVYEEEEVS